MANPVLQNISSGNIQVNQTGNSTVINQNTSKGIINWKSFNMGKDSSVHFQQPSGGVTLNRINPTQGVSQIYGQITATGKIILINPAGIYFGPTASVNVGGLIATTADIKDNDFLQGNYQFKEPSAYSGAIINEGQIIAREHGLVALVAPSVINNGMIQANLGHVILASGETFTVNFSNDNLINFSVDTPTSKRARDKDNKEIRDGVVNNGTLVADGGKVLISAKSASGILDNVINLGGNIQARSVAQIKGEIILSGGTNGIVRVASKINASGRDRSQHGGNISITGQKILIDNNAEIDVSGDNGGGNIFIGGNYQGKGPLMNAQATVVMPEAKLLADAISSGNGGEIIVWSNEVTKVHGLLSARGGALTGNGGFIETSGHYLDISGIKKVDLTASKGLTGTWLLDPADVNITSNPPTTGGTFSSDTFTPTSGATVSNLYAGDLATQLNSANILVVTNNASVIGNGDITFNDPSNILSSNWTSSNTLTLQADRNITFNSALSLSGTGKTLILTAGTTNTAGSISINSAMNGAFNLNLSAGSLGTITISAALGGVTPLAGITTNARPTTINSNVTTTGNQTYAGTVNAGAGVIFKGSSLALQSSVNIGASVTFNNSAASSIAGPITGVSLVKDGPGTLTLLSGTSTYFAGTTVLDGAISFATLISGGFPSSLGTLGQSTHLGSAGHTATLIYTGPAATVNRNFIIDGGTAVFQNAGTGLVTFFNGAFTFNSSTAGTINNLILDTGANGITFSASPITNTNGSVLNLTKLGSGTLTINTGASSYTGTTTIQQGTLSASNLANSGSNSSIGQSGLIFITSGGNANFNYTGGAVSTNLGFTITGSGTSSVTNSGSGLLTLTGNGTYAVTTNGTSNQSLTFDTGANGITVGGVIKNPSNNLSIVKSGAGTLTLSGANTYTGSTTINTGTITAGASNVLADTTQLILGNSTTFNLNGNTDTIGSISGSGSITLGAGQLTSGGDNTSTTYSGIISGVGGSIRKTGNGVLTLSGINTYNGGTTLLGGTLSINTQSNIGSSAASLIFDGGTLRITSGTATIANPILIQSTATIDPFGQGWSTGTGSSLSGNITGAVGTTLNINDSTGGPSLIIFSGNNTGYAGNVLITSGIYGIGSSNALNNILTQVIISSAAVNAGLVSSGAPQTIGNTLIANGNFTLGKSLTFLSSSSIVLGNNVTIFGDNQTAGPVTPSTIAGIISDGGNGYSLSFDLGSTNANTSFILSGANTFTGNVNLNGGVVVELTSNNPLQNNLVTVNGASNLQIGANNVLGGLAGNGLVSVSAGSPTLTLGNNNGNHSFSGVISGNLSIVKNGTGSLTLSGANTYTGSTTINNGSIIAANSNALGTIGSVQINASGVLTVSNANLGAATINLNGGILSGAGSSSIVNNINLLADSTISSSGFFVLNTISNPFALSLQGTGTIQLNGAVNIGSLSTSVTGATVINTPTIATSGNQLYQNNLVLASDASLIGNNITITNNITGNKNLALTANTMTINAPLSVNNLSFTGSGSNNTVTLDSASAQTWNITNNNVGSIFAAGINSGTFSNIQNLIGGASDDTFVLSNGVQISHIDGGVIGNSTNIINYLPYSASISVVLGSTIFDGLAKAGGVTINGFSNINSLFATAANNNSITLPIGKTNAQMVVTGPYKGYIGDPLFFDGFGTFTNPSGNGTVTFPSYAIIKSTTSAQVLNSLMRFFGFNLIGNSTNDIARIITIQSNNQSQTNGADISENISDILTRENRIYDQYLRTIKITRFCPSTM